MCEVGQGVGGGVGSGVTGLGVGWRGWVGGCGLRSCEVVPGVGGLVRSPGVGLGGGRRVLLSGHWVSGAITLLRDRWGCMCFDI